MAARPEIYAIHPDTDIQNHFKGVYGACQIITGKNFGPDVTVWTWTGPAAKNEERLAAALRVDGSKPGTPWEVNGDDAEDPSFNPDNGDSLIPLEYTPDDPALLPSRPPSGSDAAGVRKADILSVSPTVLTTSLPEGAVIVWVRNRDGWSLPYLVGVARPYWINMSTVRAGDYFSIVGMAIGRDHVGGRALLRGGKTPIFINATGSPRSGGWYTDRFIRYIQVPTTTKPGRYEVFFHNKLGGIYGWSFAGAIEVLPTQPVVLPVLIAGEHGVKADGITDDTPALMALLQKAANTKADVVLPAGVIRITRTLAIPAGVTVRGAGREQTVMHGTGFAPDAGLLPAPLVTMASHTRLQYLALDGAVAGTPNADGTLVRLETDTERILISECTLRAESEDPATDAPLYRYAVKGERCTDVRISESAIQGTVQVQDADRVAMVKNTVTDAHWQGQALALAGARCLVDANVFTQAPGRLALAPLARSVIRLNEIHYTWRGDWAVPDGVDVTPRANERLVRMATGSTATTLRDQSQKWQPGKWTGAGLLLLEGTGFGQVRRVVGNTADTLTVDRPWHALPDATSRYLLGFFSMENAYSYNYNNTIVSWDFTDNVATVMQYQRNLGAPMRFLGENQTSAATPNAFYPSWFNRVTGSYFNLAGAELYGEQADGNTLTTPATFGNVLASCILQRPGPHTHRDANDVAGIEVGGNQKAKRPGVAWSLLFGNTLIGVDLGVRITPDAMGTYVGNTYENYRMAIVDAGVGTIALPRVNRYYDANDLWTTLDGKNGWTYDHGAFGPPLPYTTGRQ
jgi:hypothetical protein